MVERKVVDKIRTGNMKGMRNLDGKCPQELVFHIKSDGLLIQRRSYIPQCVLT